MMINNLNLQIAVLEDNPGDFMLLKEQLNELQLTANTVSHFSLLKELLDHRFTSPPDVIFIDLNLPDSNGLDTFLSVNKIYSGAAIIILTGVSEEEISLQAIHEGAQDYLVKGYFDVQLLRKTLQYSLERKRNELRLQEAVDKYEIVSRATNDAVWDWNLETNEIVWNDKVAIFGYPDAIVKDAQWRSDNIFPDDLPEVEQTLQQCFRDHCDSWNQTYRFRCHDGSYKNILDRGFILHDNRGHQYRMIGSMTDITHQVALQKELEAEKINQQQAIFKASVSGQEKERNEIGRELHDNVNQMLASAKLCMSAAMANDADQSIMLNKAMEITEECIQEVRKLSATLVSPQTSQLGLRNILEQLITRMSLNGKIKFNQKVQEGAEDLINEEQSLTIYRIVQEQVNNILKHAAASEATIDIRFDNDNIYVAVNDNGKGFNMQSLKGGIGIANMKARASLIHAELQLNSAPGQGCSLRIILPY